MVYSTKPKHHIIILKSQRGFLVKKNDLVRPLATVVDAPMLYAEERHIPGILLLPPNDSRFPALGTWRFIPVSSQDHPHLSAIKRSLRGLTITMVVNRLLTGMIVLLGVCFLHMLVQHLSTGLFSNIIIVKSSKLIKTQNLHIEIDIASVYTDMHTHFA